MNLAELLVPHIEWSKQTFGTTPRVEGICKHIAKELDEIRATPRCLFEWIDVVILALDGAWRAGYSPTDIEYALSDKMEIIRARKYPKPQDDEVSEHID
jgi:phage gp29-like protein